MKTYTKNDVRTRPGKPVPKRKNGKTSYYEDLACLAQNDKSCGLFIKKNEYKMLI